jgi:excisionase family DNA binding protein
MNLEPYMTVEQMAKHLKIGRTKAYELVRSQSFPKVRVGKSIRIPTDGLAKWLSRAENERTAG